MLEFYLQDRVASQWSYSRCSPIFPTTCQAMILNQLEENVPQLQSLTELALPC